MDFNFESEVDRVSNHIISAINNKLSAFNTLNSRLIKSGSLADKCKLVVNQGLVSSKAIDERASTMTSTQNSSFLYTSSSHAPPLKKEKVIAKKTLGKGWFNLEPAEMTEELRRDIKIIQLRNSLDPKRFYKKPDKMRMALHTGTVIEGPSEYKSSRLTNRERKNTIMDEVLADSNIRAFSKRKYNEIQHEKSNKKKNFKQLRKSKTELSGSSRREKLRKTLIR